MHKDHLESQLGMFNPGEVPKDEQLMKKGTRNLGPDGKSSVASMGKDSAVSLPDEDKIHAELNKLAESEDEDGEFVNKIEGAQNVRLQAEKDDNMQLKKQVTTLQGAVRRATMKLDPAQAAGLAS